MTEALWVGDRAYAIRPGSVALPVEHLRSWFFLRPALDAPVCTVALNGVLSQWRIETGPETLTSPAYPRADSSSLAQTTAGLLFGIQADGRQLLHAAALVPKGKRGAVLLVGESGFGKSTLTLLALRAGHLLLSDDSIAVWQGERGSVLASPVRKYISVEEALRPADCEGFWLVDPAKRRKFSFDPELVFGDCRLLEAPVERLVFLDRSASFSTRSLDRSETFERLVSRCPDVVAPIRSMERIGILKLLATTVPARLACLTRESLSDERVLADLLS